MADMRDTRQTATTGQENSVPTATFTRGTFSTVTNLFGAAASLALIVGVGIWSYQLFMRDVSGVPVVRAAEGPMRVQPEDPGGQQAQHQGLSVNDVAAIGGAGGPADTLKLAPAPLDLTAEDEALPSVGQSIAQAVIRQQATASNEVQPLLALNPDDIQLAAVEQLAAQLSAGVEPLQELAPLSDAQPASEEEVQAAVAAAIGVVPKVVGPGDMDAEVPDETADDASNSVEDALHLALAEGGLGRSLRPKTRPTALTNVQPVAAVIEEVAETTGPKSGTAQSNVAEIDANSIAPGTRLAQLGAYDSPEVARAEWDRLTQRFAEYLDGKDRVVQQAKSGGRTFYRLRAAGFTDLSDARRFCSALVAEKAECIPVVTR